MATTYTVGGTDYEFPDNMPDAEVKAVLQRKGIIPTEGPKPFSVSGVGRGLKAELVPAMPKTWGEGAQMLSTLTNPAALAYHTGKQVVSDFSREQEKARTAPSTSESIAHGLASVLPIVGPGAARAGEAFGTDIGEGVGRSVAQLLPFIPAEPVVGAIGRLGKRITAPPLPRPIKPPVPTVPPMPSWQGPVQSVSEAAALLDARLGSQGLNKVQTPAQIGERAIETAKTGSRVLHQESSAAFKGLKGTVDLAEIADKLPPVPESVSPTLAKLQEAKARLAAVNEALANDPNMAAVRALRESAAKPVPPGSNPQYALIGPEQAARADEMEQAIRAQYGDIHIPDAVVTVQEANDLRSYLRRVANNPLMRTKAEGEAAALQKRMTGLIQENLAPAERKAYDSWRAFHKQELGDVFGRKGAPGRALASEGAPYQPQNVAKLIRPGSVPSVKFLRQAVSDWALKFAPDELSGATSAWNGVRQQVLKEKLLGAAPGARITSLDKIPNVGKAIDELGEDVLKEMFSDQPQVVAHLKEFAEAQRHAGLEAETIKSANAAAKAEWMKGKEASKAGYARDMEAFRTSATEWDKANKPTRLGNATRGAVRHGAAILGAKMGSSAGAGPALIGYGLGWTVGDLLVGLTGPSVLARPIVEGMALASKDGGRKLATAIRAASTSTRGGTGATETQRLVAERDQEKKSASLTPPPVAR